MLDLAGQRILVTGGSGFLGRSVIAKLRSRGVPVEAIAAPSRASFDLTEATAAHRMLSDAFPGALPTAIIHCAGFVGGLGANRAFPAQFFHENLAMGLHLIEAARRLGFSERGVFVQIGTMCSYGAHAPLPYKEESLYIGRPDPEFAPYGVAKLVLLQMLEAYRLQYGLRSIYLIPTSLYGPGDNLSPETSHLAGALIRRFVEAADSGTPEVICWGTGSPLRDLIYIDDAAEGVVRALEVLGDPQAGEAGPINLGSGQEVSVREVAQIVAHHAGYRGRIVWDVSKGDGVPRRSLDTARARRVLNWDPKMSLDDGLARTIRWYRGRA